MQIQPPPTWALPILIDEKTNKATFHPVWLKWFLDLSAAVNSVTDGGTGLTETFNTTVADGHDLNVVNGRIITKS